jgi:hypothetical protein
MKNILLLFFVMGLTMLSSCENNPVDMIVPEKNNFLKASINGTEIIFDHADVVKEVVDEHGNIYTDLVITTHKRSDNSTKIIFRVEYMRTGTETCYYFTYNYDDAEHDIENGDSFAVDITQSTANHIEGNFSGTLSDYQNNTVAIDNGHFDITF